MRAWFTFILILTSFHLSFAQDGPGSIKGRIINHEDLPLEKATISILNKQDSSVISYGMTDSKGEFNFIKIPSKKPLIIFITHIEGSSIHQDFELNAQEKKDFGNIKLSINELEEVLVSNPPPVRMNKDTLEYNMDYFKTLPNANLEELIKQLPGLQVNMDGTIYYEGKEVSSVKVNGKDFFASDLKIATRNLDASLVKTVQVYRDRGESKEIVENEEDLPVTINLKFKKDFLRADFGKMYASGGTHGRYEAGALVNTFRDTLQVSLIAFGNNINRQSFEYSELQEHGGLSRAESNEFQNFGGRNWDGLGNDVAGGINITNDWGKNTKLNVMYMTSYKKIRNESQSNQVSLFDDVRQFAEYESTNNSTNWSHDITSLFRHRFDTTAFFEFKPSVSLKRNNGKNFTDISIANDSSLVNSTIYDGFNSGNTSNYNHDFFIEKQFSKNHIVSFRNNIGINSTKDQNENLDSTRFYLTTPNEVLIWQNLSNSNSNNNLSFSINYGNKSIEKLNFELYQSYVINSSKPEETILVNRNNTGVYRAVDSENSYKFSYQDHISGIKFFWKPIDKLSVNFGTAYQIKNNHFAFNAIEPDNKTQKTYWLPNISIRYDRLNISWSKDVRPPNTYAFRLQDNTLSPTSIRLRSEIFGNVSVQQFGINYNKYSNKYQAGFYANGNYSDKSVGYRIWRDLTTANSTSQAFQSGEVYSTNLAVYFRYTVLNNKTWQLDVSQNSYAYTHQNYSTINDVANRTTQFQMNFDQEFSMMYKNKIGISPKYTLSSNRNFNSVKDNSDFVETNYLSHNLGIGLKLIDIKSFTLESSYSLQNKASGLNERENFHILNASLYYNFKNKSQIKLTGFDILNQNVSNHWGVSGNTNYFYNSMTLQQYFLLGYVYKFNILKTK
ncbi:carboxypeptidase regulatory-like domain-containing protein [Sphingobacterium hungaricum]